ncbi:sensor histidine kinase [Chitinophaga pinensis]|nr:sensor histidine kinase [Chitinophaga pinensis]
MNTLPVAFTITHSFMCLHSTFVDAGTGYPLYAIAGIVLLLVTGVVIWRQGRKYHQALQEITSLRCKLNEFDRYLGNITREKDWLIEETHHRVKNNLQMAISLLNTQYTFLADNEARQAVRNTQHRMFAISLVYQKLYQEDALSTIDIPQYISELLDYLKDEYEVAADIDFNLKTVPLKLDVTLAIPFGLIITEAISNIFRHAFTGREDGSVYISMQSNNGRHYKLLIKDNGVGLPVSFDPYADTSMGLMLMTGLSRQVRGTLQICNDNGVTIVLEFLNDGRLPENL